MKRVSDSGGEGIMAPIIISDIAIDVRSEAFKLDLYKIGKPTDNYSTGVGSRVRVEFIWSQDEFARLASACPMFDPEIFDENASVVICKRDAQRLGIFHGSILELKPTSSQKGGRAELGQIETKPCSAKKVKLTLALVTDCGRSEMSDDLAIVKMLPVLWFNLCRMAPDSSVGLNISETRLCFLSRLQQQQPADVVNSSSLPLPVPYANEVIVSSINSPQYNNAMSCDFLLKFYFSKPRMLQEGDVFAVHSAVDPRLFESIPEGSDVRHPVVYFKVKKLRSSEKRSSSACLVDRHKSELLQESSVHSYIPSEMSSFYSTTFPLSDCYHSLQRVFADHINSLLEILRPFIANKRRFQDLYPIVLLSGPVGSGLISLSRMLAEQLNMHHYRMNCSHLVTDTAATSEAKINQYLQIVGAYSPCILLLDAVDLVGKDRDGREDSRVASYFVSALKKLVDDSSDLPVIVIATTSAAAQVSHDINQCFLHCVNVEVPKESKRLEILGSLLSDESLSSDVSLSHLAQRSAGMVLDDFLVMLSYVRQSAYHRISTQRSSGLSCEANDLPLDVKLIQEDFESALNRMQSMHSESIGAPKIPNVTWDDVGGLANVKKDILDTIQLPLQHPQLLSLGLRRSGILLYGPPGTGKTLLAKAVATECSLNFLSVKGPELLNMYVGQSEENIRHVFERARAATPCVIFFDELDSLAPNRGRSGDSGGVMDRVVSQLLAELDGLNKSNSVFVIGATNRPDLLDPALLRPGRFDKLVYLGVSEDRESQLKILKALTRKFDLGPDFQLEDVVKKCPLNLTGADFYALSADAMLNAIRRRIDELNAGTAEGATDSVKLEVSESDFLFALDNLIPSLSDVELGRYKLLQSHYATSPSKAIA